jgi:hypothetical protein
MRRLPEREALEQMALALRALLEPDRPIRSAVRAQQVSRGRKISFFPLDKHSIFTYTYFSTYLSDGSLTAIFFYLFSLYITCSVIYSYFITLLPLTGEGGCLPEDGPHRADVGADLPPVPAAISSSAYDSLPAFLRAGYRWNGRYPIFEAG